MKKIVLCGFLCMLFFIVACTDDSATDAEYASRPSSISDAVLTSSSSLILSSSDFALVESSSSVAQSSSVSNVTESSSSIYIQHSEVLEDSSIFNSEQNKLLDLRDSQEYRTVVIGTQTWMAENLNYAYLEPAGYQDSSSWCYGNERDSCFKYGRLYYWGAAVDGAGIFGSNGKGCFDYNNCKIVDPVRGICPKGWHLPSKEEFEVLVDFVGGEDVAGKKLKSSEGWLHDGNGTDEYGFCAKPAGWIYRIDEVDSGESLSNKYSLGGYASLAGEIIKFWTSFWGIESGVKGEKYFRLGSENYIANGLIEMYFNFNYAFSIRCLKD